MKGRNNGTPIEILLVEDNPGDIRLTEEAFKEAKVLNKLHVVRDGIEAMSFLQQQTPYQEASLPDLILLDLNMPRKDGREVLIDLKNDLHLRRIPVVILTTSEAEKDILKSYDLHANAYIVKPVDLDQFLQVVKAIEIFWLGIARLPPV
jgi:CheY-like chemotaxis protein